jgi:hypothetical protein
MLFIFNLILFFIIILDSYIKNDNLICQRKLTGIALQKTRK